MMNTAQATTNQAPINQWLGDGQIGTIKIGHSFSTTSERSLDAHEHLFLTTDKQTQIYQVIDGVIGTRRNEREDRDEMMLHVPMTRSEIADYLGLTIETVSRNITKLKTTGLIKLESKSSIRVMDIDELEDIAEGAR